ncbi:sigma-54-dependent Fis family transcriptional regulator [Pararhodospirillum photometricum]|nr:sigma-54-dependent Fis family transcriptional regulator [Pararhodospirillum photometricum]
MVGSSSALQRVRSLIDKIAPTDRPLLILGETGTGKEVVARRIHALSGYAEGPFVDVNCGAIPESLVESELFGHVKGAFTGASAYRPGTFSQATKGTLFLDEIGELPVALQPKLLRVLETRLFRPVGSAEPLHFEGRIIAATHRDLRAMVAEGSFREDLYYRLAVFTVELPTLEQRRGDIPDLVRHFALRQPRPLSFSPAALSLLRQQPWPGNIRQLRNLIDQLGVLAETPEIGLAVLEPFLAHAPEPRLREDEIAEALLRLPGDDKLLAAENLLIDHALARCDGNKSAAAKVLGVSRKVIERRLKSRDAPLQRMRDLLDDARLLVDSARYREAIVTLRRCLKLQGEGDGEGEEEALLLFDVYRLLGISLRSVNGWLCAEAQDCYQAALNLGRGDPLERAHLQFGIWGAQLMALDLVKARASAQDMIQHALSQSLGDALGDAYVALANTLFWLGDAEEALACLARCQLLGVDRTEERLGGQGIDLANLALTLEGLAAFRLGSFAQARKALAMLVRRLETQRFHAFNHALTLQGAAWLSCLFEEREATGTHGSALETLSREYGFTFYQGVGQIFRGIHEGWEGEPGVAEAVIQEGYDTLLVRRGGRLFHSFQAWHRALALLAAGRSQEALAAADLGVEVAMQTQDRAYLGELLVVRARARRALGEEEEACQDLYGALSTAQALGSVAARVEAATALAQVLRETGRAAAGTELLTRALRGVALSEAPPLVQRALALLATDADH